MNALVNAPALEAALKELNERLKAGKHRARIEQRRNRLYARATLPDRKDPTQSRQQSLALGLDATLEGVRQAEMHAMRLSFQLLDKSFRWADWTDDRSTSSEAGFQLTVEDFQQAAKKLHAAKYHKDPERGKNAWAKKWAPALKKMPPSGPVTESVLLRIIRLMPSGTASRRDQGNLLSQVAKSMGLETGALLEACRGYGVDKLTERDIPTDRAIEAAMERITLPHWRWAFGMCATFGLRPHECAELTWIDDQWIEIHDKTKTGSRRVTACPSGWVSDFNLRELPRPPQSATRITKALNDALDRDGVTIKPYNLRHAYALRLMDKGVGADLAARLMGHSLQVHQTTYQKWIEADRIQKAMAGIRL